MYLSKEPNFTKPLERSHSANTCQTRGRNVNNTTATAKQPTLLQPGRRVDDKEQRSKCPRITSSRKASSQPPDRACAPTAERSIRRRDPQSSDNTFTLNTKSKKPSNLQMTCQQPSSVLRRCPSSFQEPLKQNKNDIQSHEKNGNLTVCSSNKREQATQSKITANQVDPPHSRFIQKGRGTGNRSEMRGSNKDRPPYSQPNKLSHKAVQEAGQSLMTAEPKKSIPLAVAKLIPKASFPKGISSSADVQINKPLSQLRKMETSSRRAVNNCPTSRETEIVLPALHNASQGIHKPLNSKLQKTPSVTTRSNVPLNAPTNNHLKSNCPNRCKWLLRSADKLLSNNDVCVMERRHASQTMNDTRSDELSQPRDTFLTPPLLQTSEVERQRVSDSHWSSHSSKSAVPRSFQSLKSRRRRKQDCHRDIGEWMNAVDAAVVEIISSDSRNTVEPTSALLSARQHLGTLVLLTADTSTSISITSSPQIPAEARLPSLATREQKLSSKSSSLSSFSNSLRPSDSQSASIRESTTTPRPNLFETNPSMTIGSSSCNSVAPVNSGNHGRVSRHSSGSTSQCTPPSHQSAIDAGHSAIPKTNRKTPQAVGSRRRRLSPSEQDSALSSLTSIIRYRFVQRRAVQASGMLFGGIRLRNPATVREALKTFDADPNEYFNVPTSHLPWTLLAPFQYQSPGSSPGYKSFSSPPGVVPPYMRLHPLHLAVAISSYAVVQALIDGGCCVNALDSFHRNPLHVLIQSPPINLPLPQNDSHSLSSWPARITDTVATPTDHLVYETVSRFLHIHAGKISSNETKIASLLCNEGIDLTRCDAQGRNCVDHATDWLRVSRLIRSGCIVSQLEPIPVAVPNRSCPPCHPVDCPIPIHVQPPIANCSPAELSARIPHSIVDIILSYEDRLRLLAIAPIVGLNVGGHLSPHQFIRVNGQPLHTNHPHGSIACSALAHTPTCCTPESTVNENPLPETTRVRNVTMRQPLVIKEGKCCLFSPQVRRPSRARHAAYLHGVTISSPSPGVTQMAVRLTPQMQSARLLPQEKPTVTPTQKTLAESCLRAFKRSVANQAGVNHFEQISKPVSSCEEGFSPSRNDLAVFLNLASSSKYRCHSALLPIWEFLGANVVSSLTENHNTIPTDESSTN